MFGGAAQGGTAQRGSDSSGVADVTPPTPIYKAQAEYPEEARRAKSHGSVLLSVEDDSAGVRNINVMRSLSLGLDDKAVEAVKQWKPVSVLVEVEMNFRLL
jgi:protein TonB